LQVRVKVLVALSGPVLALPLVGSLPDHPPDALQLVALVDDQLNVAAEPLLTVPGLALMLTAGLTTAELTVIAKAGNDADAYTSLVLITIPEYVPTSVAAGVPLNCPVALLKPAQPGFPVMENVRLFPAGSLVVGVKEYAVPTVTLVPGVPEIVGGAGDGAAPPASTCTENGGKVAVFRPSLTAITMFEYVPTLPAEGVPAS
jgi:hypothetical protein